MKLNLKKISAGVALAFFAVAFTPGFNNGLEFAAKAEAGGILGNIFGSKDGKDVGQEIKDAAGDALNKAFAINLDGMNSRRNDMKVHLALAAKNLAGAKYQLGIATEQPALEASCLAIHNELGKGLNISSINRLGQIKSAVDTKSFLANVLSSGNQQLIAKTTEHVTLSNNQRAMSLIYQGLALRDANFILKETAKGFADIGKVKNPGDAEGKLNELKAKLKDFSDFAGEVKTLCDIIGKQNKGLNDSIKDYKKKTNIKEPDKKELEAQAKAMTAR